MRKIIVLLTLAVAAIVTAIALATPSSGVSAETARGTFDALPKVNTEYENGGRVKLQVRGPVELISQRIVAEPGATFGWHKHPGENVNVVAQGAVTVYHDENCTEGITYPAGSAFMTHPDEVHIARNLGTTQLVIFSTYFAPKTVPGQPFPVPPRTDQPLPPGCTG